MWSKADFLRQFLDSMFERIEVTCTDRVRVEARFLNELPDSIDGQGLCRVIRNTVRFYERSQTFFRYRSTKLCSSALTIEVAVEEFLAMTLSLVESGGTECTSTRIRLKGISCLGHHEELLVFLMEYALLGLFRSLDNRRSLGGVLAQLSQREIKRIDYSINPSSPIRPKEFYSMDHCIS